MGTRDPQRRVTNEAKPLKRDGTLTRLSVIVRKTLVAPMSPRGGFSFLYTHLYSFVDYFCRPSSRIYAVGTSPQLTISGTNDLPLFSKRFLRFISRRSRCTPSEANC